MIEALKERTILPTLLKQSPFWLTLLLLFYLLSQINFLLFHGLVELFSVAVAWSVLLLVWNTQRIARNDALLFLGIAYFFIGLIDLLHTLSYKGMGIFPMDQAANHATQLWVAARIMEAATLFSYPLLIGKSIRRWPVVILFSVITAGFCASIFSCQIFPVCYVEGDGLTLFKKSAEYCVCLVLLFAMIFLKRKKKSLDTSVYSLMISAMFVTIAAELSFTLYVSVYGFFSVIGHFFKLISFFLIYYALVRSSLVRPYGTLFKHLEEEKKSLQISEGKLKEAERIAKLGYWELDPATHALSWSAGVFTIFEKNPTTFTPSYDAFLDTIHPEDRGTGRPSLHGIDQI